MEQHTISIWRAFEWARTVIGDNLGTIFRLGIIWNIIFFITLRLIYDVAPHITGETMPFEVFTHSWFLHPSIPRGVGIIWSLFLLISGMYVYYQHLRLGLDLYNNKPISIRGAFTYSLRTFIYFLAARLLHVAKVFLGLIALIIPGVYVATSSYFAGFFILDDGVLIQEDAQLNKTLTQSLKWLLLPLWLIDIAAAGLLLMIIIFSTFMASFLWLCWPVVPSMVLLMHVHIYKQLKEASIQVL